MFLFEDTEIMCSMDALYKMENKMHNVTNYTIAEVSAAHRFSYN